MNSEIERSPGLGASAAPGDINPDELVIEVVDEDEDSKEESAHKINEDLKDFDCNLALHLDDGEMMEIATSLMQDVENDEASRAEWSKNYKQSLVYLGISSEEKSIPWPGCANVVTQ